MYNDNNTPYLSERDRIWRAFALLDIFRLLTNEVPADAVYLYCRNTGAFPVWSFGDAVMASTPEGDNQSITSDYFVNADDVLATPKSLQLMAKEYLVNNWVKKCMSIFMMLGWYNETETWFSRRGVIAFPIPWKQTIAAAYIPNTRVESISQVRNAITSLHSAIVQSVLAGEMNRFIKDRRSWAPLEYQQQQRINDLMWIIKDSVRRAVAKNEIPDAIQMELICKGIEILIMIKGCLESRWEDNLWTYLCYNNMKRESTSWLIDRCNGGNGPDGVTREKCIVCCDRSYRNSMIDGAMFYLAHVSPAAALCIGNIFKPGWNGQRVYDDRVLNALAKRLNKRPEPCVGIYFQYESDLQLQKMKFFQDRFVKKNSECGSPEACEAPCCG